MTKNNKNNKKNKIRNNINLKSKKTRFGLVVVLIALMGGGLFTVSSFANTVVYSATSYGGTLSYDKNTPVVRRTEPQKNKQVVYEMSKNGWVGTPNGYYTVNPGWYKTCVVAKGYGYLKLQPRGLANDISQFSVAVTNRSSYNKYCTRSNYFTDRGQYYPFEAIHIGGELIRVSQMTLEK